MWQGHRNAGTIYADVMIIRKRKEGLKEELKKY
jgi:hypothetical protein